MISIIIPVKNQLSYTKQILEDIQRKVLPIYEVIIIDDGSTDGTWDYLSSMDIRGLISMQGEGNGVNSAWNQGARVANGEYLWFLNNDVVLTEGLGESLKRALRFAKITCPYTTSGKDKFMLPVTHKDDMLEGWCFMLRAKDYPKIDERLDLWYGDNYIYESLGKDVAHSGLVHHYESKTIKSPEFKKECDARIRKDAENWKTIKSEKGW